MFKLENPCTLCHDAAHYNQGLLGKNYENTGIMMVLHISDSRALTGYEDAYLNTNTGRTINKILEKSELTLDDVLLTNFWKCLRPEDKMPTKTQYQNCRSVFEKQVLAENPNKMVLFGSPVYSAYADPTESFKEAAGSVKKIHGLDTFISYHPSGMRLINREVRRFGIDEMVKYLKK